jgi:hypothetical protein
LMVGNPARQKGWMCSCAHQLGTPSQLPENSQLACTHCGASFARNSEGLLALAETPGARL